MTDYTLPPIEHAGGSLAIVAWLAAPGAALARGEPMLVIVGERAEVALPAPEALTLDEILVAEGEIAPGAVLARYTPRAPAPAAAPAATPPARMTPVARSIAARESLDLTGVAGSGPGGRITKRDVRQALARRPRVSSPSAAPAVTTVFEADMSRVLAACARHGPSLARRGLALTPLACVALLAARALERRPLTGATWAGDALLLRRRLHLRVLTSPPRTLADIQDLNLRGVARALGAPPALDRHPPTLTLAEAEGLLTVAPPGASRWPTPCLILGAARLQPVVVAAAGERIDSRPIARLALCYDPRALPQAQADAFLADLKRMLEALDTRPWSLW